MKGSCGNAHLGSEQPWEMTRKKQGLAGPLDVLKNFPFDQVVGTVPPSITYSLP